MGGVALGKEKAPAEWLGLSLTTGRYLVAPPDFLGVVFFAAGFAGVDCAFAAFAAVGLAAF